MTSGHPSELQHLARGLDGDAAAFGDGRELLALLDGEDITVEVEVDLATCAVRRAPPLPDWHPDARAVTSLRRRLWGVGLGGLTVVGISALVAVMALWPVEPPGPGPDSRPVVAAPVSSRPVIPSVRMTSPEKIERVHDAKAIAGALWVPEAAPTRRLATPGASPPAAGGGIAVDPVPGSRRPRPRSVVHAAPVQPRVVPVEPLPTVGGESGRADRMTRRRARRARRRARRAHRSEG